MVVSFSVVLRVLHTGVLYSLVHIGIAMLLIVFFIEVELVSAADVHPTNS